MPSTVEPMTLSSIPGTSSARKSDVERLGLAGDLANEHDEGGDQARGREPRSRRARSASPSARAGRSCAGR